MPHLSTSATLPTKEPSECNTTCQPSSAAALLVARKSSSVVLQVVDTSRDLSEESCAATFPLSRRSTVGGM